MAEADIMLNRKNNKSNVMLQPLNYKSTNLPMPGVQNVAQGIEDILKNHQISFNTSSQESMPQSFYA